MKIEIIELDYESLNEKCSGMTCFDASNWVHDKIHKFSGIAGICIIDNTAVKFSFSCLGNDGDIFTKDDMHRMTIKSLIPIYAFNKYVLNA